ncbi:MAG: signal transduction histidine-protein kinase BaeS [Candidatus Methanofastidiosum methylothiophilum]|uniref:histidine kinase n=1 Tax=Candidatus Methanofastidiosum methylothiophilum TaxID=1705564 RepID=A0A150JLS0_9EURY|nr:MAG: signal transduction histidine-protein kinase BaeS [Candidatus Methanofastidiosum methylthiophilus]OQC52633.1 MAG: signal transduction histidine-protein kinase BaeS [Euryarchaeota archaeon ADurb.Bin023]HNV93996.1 ATP-binding protein [Methanofastidiosum sp.]KYC57423.1 MAG: signal transduction histidine-protein kinase BaeS [Candidatus Methanofastidiosum methylthiophilus]KYC58209.1 MAG: signal transduction histidine-protein kinase BaeS [Candidatus Methanofastidiosum methylthiophilus]
MNYLVLSTFFFNLLLGIYSIKSNYKSKINILFSILAIFMSGIIITNSLIIERSYILWWNKLNLFFVIWIPTLYLMWSTSLSKIKMKINEIYVISISIFFSLTLVTNLFINNVSYFNGKLEQLYGPFFYVFFIYYVSCLIYGLYLLNQASKLCDSLIERRRYLIVFIGTLIPIATSIILNSIIYIGKLRTFFHFDELTGNIYVLPITNSLMMILFAFAVLKYNFLKPDISIKEKLDTLRIKILYITNIIIIGLGIIISIIIINSGYPVDTTIIETIFVIVFLMFFIDIGINYSLSKYIKEKIIVPLGKISKHAEEVGKGNFNIKVGFEGEDEIAILSRQMDEMADKLNKTSMIRENFNKALQIEVQKTTEKLQEAYNQLKDSDKAKKDFIDAIAHELYNPLAIISLSNEYIQLDSIDPHNKKMITSIQRNIKRLIYLVKEIEDFTTIDLQDQKINVEKFDLEEMIKIIVQDFGILTSKKNIELSLKPIGQDFNLEGDKSKLTKVFVNLIENAVTFSNEDGKIKIIIEDRKENIEVKIEDNGIGIRKKDIKYIFEKFYRAEVDDVLRQGIGLGLPIARSIVINHDGIINVKSEYGKGSVFTVILPKKHVVL